MSPGELVMLTALMKRTNGSPHVKVGLIDGPVFTQHPDLENEHLSEIPGNEIVRLRALRPKAWLACMGPLWPESCVPREVQSITMADINKDGNRGHSGVRRQRGVDRSFNKDGLCSSHVRARKTSGTDKLGG
jgi:hypothetical protein